MGDHVDVGRQGLTADHGHADRVHDDQPALRWCDHARHGFADPVDGIDPVNAPFERAGSGGCVTRVDAHQSAGGVRYADDIGQAGCQARPFLVSVEGDGAGAGRFSAHIQALRPVRDQRGRSLHRERGVRRGASLGKRVRRYV